MFEQVVNCLTDSVDGALPLFAVRPAALAQLLADRPAEQAGYLTATGFTGAAGEVRLLPGVGGIAAAVIGLGDDQGPHAFGKLAFDLPEGIWQMQPGDYEPTMAVLGFCLGAYHFGHFVPAKRAPARLVRPVGMEPEVQAAEAVWLARDLINMPANYLGPSELADAAGKLAARHGAQFRRIEGTELTENYPTVAAVGEGAARPPVVAELRWGGAGPLVSLCGKGVCFDTGGYDLKPSSAMLRMKKDMGGAAIVLGLAHMIMAARLPVRLVARLGCVENSVSGTAMRPLDVLRTRRGLHVEVGNTDAEGRLVLCDLLAEASDEQPDILIDYATLTGAARAALGPDLPALFCNNDDFAADWQQAGMVMHDPVWRLPLWAGYDSWLKSPVADLNNVSSKSFAGAIVAALFLQRFLRPGVVWAHLDTYAWNDSPRPGRPEGGEAQALRAGFAAICRRISATVKNESRG